MTLLTDALEELGTEYLGANWLTTAMNCGVKRNTDADAPFPYVLWRGVARVGYAEIISCDEARNADTPIPLDSHKLVSALSIWQNEKLRCYLVIIWCDCIGLIDLTSWLGLRDAEE
jgi:hypothetical protein